MQKIDQKKLVYIVNLSTELAGIYDFDMLLQKLLEKARHFANADAGSIYIKEGELLKFSASQNETMQARLGEGKKLPFTVFTIPINNSSIVGYVAGNGKIVNLKDAYRIPAKIPYKLSKSFDKINNYRTKSMLTIPCKNGQGDVIGVLQLINARDKKGNIIPFDKSDIYLYSHFAYNAAVALERAKLLRTFILRTIGMSELRDPAETGAHVNRVGAYAVEIYDTWAQSKKLSAKHIEQQKDVLRIAAMLHDVGKVAISDMILKKPGRFTPEEYEIMKAHTYLGAKLFNDPSSTFDVAARDVILNHHERWDGNGYPGYVDNEGHPLPDKTLPNGKAMGKKGEEIPLFGRIVAIADVFDALSSRRVYKEAWTDDEVIKEIKAQAGHQFDPELVEAFLASLDQINSIRKQYQ